MISSTKPINKTSTQLKVKTTFCTISSVLSFHFSPISAWCGGSEVTSPALLYLVSLCLCCFFSVFITLFKNGRQSKFVARNSTEFRDENTCCNRLQWTWSNTLFSIIARLTWKQQFVFQASRAFRKIRKQISTRYTPCFIPSFNHFFVEIFNNFFHWLSQTQTCNTVVKRL